MYLVVLGVVASLQLSMFSRSVSFASAITLSMPVNGLDGILMGGISNMAKRWFIAKIMLLLGSIVWLVKLGAILWLE